MMTKKNNVEQEMCEDQYDSSRYVEQYEPVHVLRDLHERVLTGEQFRGQLKAMTSPESLFVIGIDPSAGLSGEAQCVFIVTLNHIYLLGGQIIRNNSKTLVPYLHAKNLLMLIDRCHKLQRRLSILVVIENNWGYGVPFYQTMTTLIAKVRGSRVGKYVFFAISDPESKNSATKNFGVRIDRKAKWENMILAQNVFKGVEDFFCVNIDGFCVMSASDSLKVVVEQYNWQKIYTKGGIEYTGIDEKDKRHHPDDMYFAVANTLSILYKLLQHDLMRRVQYMDTVKRNEAICRTEMDQYLDFYDKDNDDNQYAEVVEIPHNMPAVAMYTTLQQTACVAYCSLFYACAKGLDALALFLQRAILHSYLLGASCPHGYEIERHQQRRMSISWKSYYNDLVSFYNAPLECRSTPYVSVRFTGADGKMWFPIPPKYTATEHNDILRYLNEMLKLSFYLARTQATNHPTFANNLDMSNTISEILSDILNRYITLLTVHRGSWCNIPLATTIHSRNERAGSGGGSVIPVAIMDMWYDVLHHQRIMRRVYATQRSKLLSQCMMKEPPCWRIDSTENPLCANIRLVKGNRVPYKEVVECILGSNTVRRLIECERQKQHGCKNSYRIRRVYY